VCHNFQQPGHYARECPLPPATCMYCRATDHDTEDCTTLLGKIQEKGIRTIRMYSGSLQKLEKMEGTST
jgi:hypothetical protein